MEYYFNKHIKLFSIMPLEMVYRICIAHLS